MSIEQMIRDLLCQAVKDGLVEPVSDAIESCDDFSAGDVIACANMLQKWIYEAVERARKDRDECWLRVTGCASMEEAEDLRDAVAKINDRWQAAAGCPLEQQEELAKMESERFLAQQKMYRDAGTGSGSGA